MPPRKPAILLAAQQKAEQAWSEYITAIDEMEERDCFDLVKLRELQDKAIECDREVDRAWEQVSSQAGEEVVLTKLCYGILEGG